MSAVGFNLCLWPSLRVLLKSVFWGKNIFGKKLNFPGFGKNAFGSIFGLEEALFLSKNSLFRNTFVPKMLLRSNAEQIIYVALTENCNVTNLFLLFLSFWLKFP